MKVKTLASAASAIAALNAAIEAIRACGDPASYAPAVATALRTELVAQLNRGEGPDGKPWPLTAEGGKPLQGAAAALRVVAIGPRVVASIGGRYYYHAIGKTRGNIARPILPARKLSAPAERAVRKAMIARFAELARGGT